MRWKPPLRLKAAEGENALSFVSRLALRNSEPNIGSFARDLGTTVDELRFGHSIEDLEQSARLLPGTLIRWTPEIRIKSRTVRLGATILRLNDLDAQGRRWCPACFADDRLQFRQNGVEAELGPYHRAIWDVSLVSSCPFHHTPLRQSCPRCQATQGWDHAPIDFCNCGKNLSSEMAWAGDPDGLSRFASARIVGEGYDPSPLLKGLLLSDAMPLIERLGLTALERPGNQVASLSRCGVDACRSVGFQIACDWPKSFVSALDRVTAHRTEPGQAVGLTITYGWIHRYWIRKLKETSSGSALKDALYDHAVANGILKDGEKALGRGDEPSNVTLVDASQQLGMSEDRTLRLLQRQGALPRRVRQRVPTAILRKDVERLRSMRQRRLDTQQTRRTLGIGKAHIPRLLKLGLLDPIDDGYGRERFDAEDVDRLLREVCEGLAEIQELERGWLPLPRMAVRSAVPLTELIHRVVQGSLTPIGILPGPPSISKVVVRRVDVAQRAVQERVEMTLTQTAKTLGIHRETVSQLSTRRLIFGRRGSNAWHFAASDVQRFARENVKGTEVAARLRTTPQFAIRDLAAVGVLPIIGRPACRQTLFDRSEVERHLPSLLERSANQRA